ncbi:MAG: iron dependent repressor, metal binding and dimerization domain protein [Opitutaceae bacterium]
MTAWGVGLGLLALGLLVAWPRWGVLAWWGRQRERRERELREDALKHLLKAEAEGAGASLLSLAGALRVGDGAAATVVAELERGGLAAVEAGRLQLRPAGREIALHVVRTHRLWESYLAERTGEPESRWHRLAERAEHRLTPAETAALAAKLGHPLFDPHGDRIPASGDELAVEPGTAVENLAPEQPFQIHHIEDEPETVYAHLLRLGLRPGMRAYLVSRDDAKLRLWADGAEYTLSPGMARQLSVRPLAGVTAAALRGERILHERPAGGRARLLGLTGACRGTERRRLLDLGFVPGSLVESALTGPGGDPTAYRVRGSLVALRREQARYVRVNPLPGGDS